jgi:hypothetical protein
VEVENGEAVASIMKGRHKNGMLNDCYVYPYPRLVIRPRIVFLLIITDPFIRSQAKRKQ